MPGDDIQHLPLEDLHVAANARFGAFAGWHMPITYPAGVMKEHLHTREHAGLFDISHMKLFLVSGSDAAALLARACPLDAAALSLSQSKLTFFLDERAGILDDLIVTRLGGERFMMVANAGNAAADEAHLRDWFMVRFRALRESAFTDPKSFFRQLAQMPAAEAETFALGAWDNINLVNLRENILPTRSRADLILKKAANHTVEEVMLRRV